MNTNVSDCSLAKSAFIETISSTKGKLKCENVLFLPPAFKILRIINLT